MRERTLPLRGIAVFEAAARASSFHAAAQELSLTPSAVSHQIRLLEEILGVRLFDRVGRGVTLTPDGAQYAHVVRQSIRRLQIATHDIRSRGKNGDVLDVVRVETPPSFAHCWLLPRLAGFLAQHPGIEIRVNAQGQHLQGGRLPWPPSNDAPADLQIVYGGEDLWADRAIPLVSEVIQPLCAPSLLIGNTMASPADMLRHTLIGTSLNHIMWDDWLTAQGIDLYEGRAGPIQLDPSHLAIEAAVEGIGIILESSVLAGHQMSRGNLVAPFPHLLRAGLSYWIFEPSPIKTRPAVETAIEWLRGQAVAT